jgi:hypothetical protein
MSAFEGKADIIQGKADIGNRLVVDAAIDADQ